MANSLLGRFHRACDLFPRVAANYEMSGLGRVSLAPSRADRGPQARMIQMADGDARVSRGHGILAVAGVERVLRGHLAGGRELYGRGEIQATVLQDAAERIEGG